MKPIALFDKSFLQSLTLDEAVWFDHFFIANVCPIFYAETLADLAKEMGPEKSALREVQIIADKYPETSGIPNAYHGAICLTELLGEQVPMTGQILPRGVRVVETTSGPAYVYKDSAEAEAFDRWGAGKFAQLEHDYARVWRDAIPELDPAQIGELIVDLGIDLSGCNDLSKAKTLAINLISGRILATDPIQFAFSMLTPSEEHRNRIISRWANAGCPPLLNFAPYTAHVLTVEFFFYFATARKLISERTSNRIDMAYLFYLPFCQVFVSSDNLHRRVAPLFARDDQEFVWGLELKSSLLKLNVHYSRLPDAVKETGILSFAQKPPTGIETLVTRLWDKCWPGWRREQKKKKPDHTDEVLRQIKEIQEKAKSASLPLEQTPALKGGPKIFAVQRKIRKRKGSWVQVPKDLTNNA